MKKKNYILIYLLMLAAAFIILFNSCNKDGIHPGSSEFKAIAAGGGHSLAIDMDGVLWAWGYNGGGQLGVGDEIYASHDKLLKVGSGFSVVAAGHNHSLAIKEDGTLWAWGSNECGQIGNGATGGYGSKQSTPLRIDSGYVAISAGSCHSLALRADGTLWAWGNNTSGQLGDGTTESKSTPVQVGFGYSFVTAEYDRSAGLKTDGTLWQWGSSPGLPNNPVQTGTDFTAISLGYNHILAIQSDGTLWAWGSNGYGQIGNGEGGTNVQQTIPVQIGSGFTSVAAGSWYSLGLKADGSLWAWGYNESGQLGIGFTFGPVYNPTLVGSGYSIIVTSGHTLALKTDGTLWEWGGDIYKPTQRKG